MIIRDLRGIESTQDACAKIRVSITEMEQFFKFAVLSDMKITELQKKSTTENILVQ